VASVPELLEPVGVQIDTAVVQYDDMIEVIYKSEPDGSRGEVYESRVLPYVEAVSFEVSGTLDELLAIQGDEVKKGQVLATLDPERINEQVGSLRDQINNLNTVGGYDDRQKTADIKIAQIELKMMQESGATEEACRVKELDIEILETQLKQAQEQRALEIRELERQISKISEGLGDIELTAPFDGRIVWTNNSMQTYGSKHVSANDPIFYIADDTRLSIESDYMSGHVLNNLERVYALVNGQEYELTYVPYTNEEFARMVRSGNLKTRFTFVGSTEDLQGGEMAYIIPVKNSRENVLTIPANALFQAYGVSYVKKIVDGEQQRVDVTVGLITDSKVEILSGLQEGDVVYAKE
jgi:RND family efflux transporter MFP subunit